ncbi:MAG: hypothetical protein Tsb0016_04480 [Sphingomonadales bacterium]
MPNIDDKWLEQALQDTPVIADAGFSAAIVQRVEALRRRRRRVLGLCAVLAALICVSVTPWTLALQWWLGLSGDVEAAITTAALHWSLPPLAWGALLLGAAAIPVLLLLAADDASGG